MANATRTRRAAQRFTKQKLGARAKAQRRPIASWLHQLRPDRRTTCLLTVEWLSCTIAGVAMACIIFGWVFPATAALRPAWFRLSASSGASFSAAVAVVAIWALVRQRLTSFSPALPAVVAVALATSLSYAVQRSAFFTAYHDVVSQWLSRVESERRRLAHQVYAAYRRADPQELSTIFLRAQPFLPVIEEAGRTFRVSVEVLVGIAATESSFLPRESRDGGRGLFQITLAPELARRAAETFARSRPLDLDNPRHNALLAAATLRSYLDEQHGDLFLALLAYNIGPQNGGLKEIMERYGAKDFLTIQPYLQPAPADYPIRVLAHALAYRVWQGHGKLLPYHQGQNAKTIQQLGIPGFDL